MKRFVCTNCNASEPLLGVSELELPLMPQAVGINCHKCGVPHRFVDGQWVPAK